MVSDHLKELFKDDPQMLKDLERTQKNKNLASDVILSCLGIPVLRVSTALLHMSANFGEYQQLETWVFSDLKDFGSIQRIHKQFWNNDKAVKFHNRLVRILRRKFQEFIDE